MGRRDMLNSNLKPDYATMTFQIQTDDFLTSHSVPTAIAAITAIWYGRLANLASRGTIQGMIPALMLAGVFGGVLAVGIAIVCLPPIQRE